MASSLEYVEYVCGQISGAGSIVYKKMFGEYGIYCNGKMVGVICDNQFFVKKTVSGAALIPDCKEAAPYAGAKPHLLVECIDDQALMEAFISATYNALPMPGAKKKKHDNENRK